jgi:glycosyltransferase involved in cell wall biosynthesis
MLRYTELLCAGLREAGHEVNVAAPRPVLNRGREPPVGPAKWLGYLDKYCFGLDEIAAVARSADIVHVCDHSNAPYVPRRPSRPYVVTCHDLLAVRGGLGEDTDCPATPLGRMLQRGILRGLARAAAVACVSTATQADARRLLNGYRGELLMLPNALNYPYRVLSREDTAARLRAVDALPPGAPYVLHVGSNLRRKNRECLLRAIAELAPHWRGYAVFAGQPLSGELRALAAELGVARRIVEVAKPTNELLEALYNGALALLFPSRFEGFGWPIAEAQAAGCPVICSDRAPHPEVAGDAAVLCEADDHAAFARHALALAACPAQREDLRARGLRNAARYARAAWIERFVALYARLLGYA